jgi:hypothetical protein
MARLTIAERRLTRSLEAHELGNARSEDVEVQDADAKPPVELCLLSGKQRQSQRKVDLPGACQRNSATVGGRSKRRTVGAHSAVRCPYVHQRERAKAWPSRTGTLPPGSEKTSNRHHLGVGLLVSAAPCWQLLTCYSALAHSALT